MPKVMAKSIWSPLNEADVRDILVTQHYLSPEEAKRITAAAEQAKQPFTAMAIAQELITKQLIGQAVAEHYKVPYADLERHAVENRDLPIPEGVSRQYRFVVVHYDDKTAVIATSNPLQPDLAYQVDRYLPGRKLKITYASDDMIEDGLSRHHHSLQTRFAKIMAKQKTVAPEIIDEIFNDAYALRASDIHLEPLENEVLVRFRVDGVLAVAGRIPKEFYGGILNRVKMQANLPLDEHFRPLDGGFRLAKDGRIIDIRVSIVPILEGEKIVMRFLPAYIRDVVLENLGLSESNRKLIEKAAHRPFGMILTVGPTGSGKTTTLYALFKIINRPGINITTIEDPVEYKISGINQIHVNEKQGISFHEGLRAIVRQDPDVILVGEIRDSDTADIAVNASLSGHLLLSTLHANDAVTVIPRMLDMGVEPFQLASVLQTVIAQRLVRRICLSCRASYKMSAAEHANLPAGVADYFPRASTFYRGAGCSDCADTGYKGRIAIFEILDVTPEMRALIHERPNSDALWELARSQGARTLFEDGADKVKNGITTLDELLGVAQPPHRPIKRKRPAVGRKQR